MIQDISVNDYLIGLQSGNTMVTLIVTKLVNLVLAKIINVDFID